MNLLCFVNVTVEKEAPELPNPASRHGADWCRLRSRGP